MMAATIKVTNVQEASSATTNLALDSSGNVTVGNNLTVTGTSTVSGSQTVTGTLVMGSSFKRNRIINGNMLIDQRNAGTIITPSTSGTYSLDRWAVYMTVASKFSVQQNAGSVTPPAGFKNYLGVTSTSAYSIAAGDAFRVYQIVEGYNAADLSWGSASAATITMSFWVRSSLTGTFGGALYNNAGNRAYTFSYTINAANIWEYKTITISGDTTGIWLTSNDVGIVVQFSIGAGSSNQGTPGSWGSTIYLAPTGQQNVTGTNGATWYLTGVQLEVGTKATPYEMQIYSDQLAQCQRYFEILPSSSAGIYGTPGSGGGVGYANWQYKVTKRTSPTVTLASSSLITFDYTNEWGCSGYAASGSYPYIRGGTTASAEL